MRESARSRRYQGMVGPLLMTRHIVPFAGRAPSTLRPTPLRLGFDGPGDRLRKSLAATSPNRYDSQVGSYYSRRVYPWLIALLAVLLPQTVLAQAPSLQRVTLAASSVDITTGSPKIAVEIQFTAPGLLKRASVNFVNAAGDKVIGFVDLDYPAPIPSKSGSTFSREIFLAQGRAPGEWQVMVELTDQNNVKTVYGGAGNPALPEKPYENSSI